MRSIIILSVFFFPQCKSFLDLISIAKLVVFLFPFKLIFNTLQVFSYTSLCLEYIELRKTPRQSRRKSRGRTSVITKFLSYLMHEITDDLPDLPRRLAAALLNTLQLTTR